MFRRVPLVALSLAAGSACLPAHARPAQDPWQTAVAARASFEAEPVQEHTRDEFAQIMNNFRAIYHGNPADPHAARAVEQVAQLLAEQGQQLHDMRSLRAAVGQYEFLADGYPESSQAGPGLVKALALTGRDGTDDPAEAEKIQQILTEHYPKAPAGAPDAGVDGTRQPDAPTTASHAEAPTLSGTPSVAATTTRTAAEAERAPAVVTGIRHWSTATYTRVAIDLGGEVEYKAARTEHPDRIFFDLHGAKLASGLVGRSFTVNDDGLLRSVKAAQSGPDVTRIVLDVEPVAEYSAFLLPNPYRLVIDIHGRPAAATPTQSTEAQSANPGSSVVASASQAASGISTEAVPAPIERSAPLAGDMTTRNSALPPMPVTDGSAGFGLPPKRHQPVPSAQPAAQPRVVVSSKPTEQKPVPNSTTHTTPGSTREVASVSEVPNVIEATAQPTTKPVVDRAKKPVRTTELTAAEPVQPPPLTAEGQSTLMRALGLKIGRIVIDAGHGGHDSGTLGPDGIEEKDVVLDVALRLGKLLHDRLGAEVVYTRADDTFIPLETRTAIANKAQADLFISVHANSSPDPDARGVEVYYLNFTSDPEAMQVASRENAVSSQRVNQLSDLVKKIALKDKIDESRELAADVDTSLYTGLKKGHPGLKDRGVKKAPFVVLIGANMPSILAEISFVTNPDDAVELNTPGYRERVAESLYKGIAQYAGAINGPKPKGKATERAAVR